jgi:hypothetical protein
MKKFATLGELRVRAAMPRPSAENAKERGIRSFELL